MERFRVCRHLLGKDQHHVVRFTGHGTECEYLCDACVVGPAEIVAACRACRDASGWEYRIVGEPQIVSEPSSITALHRRCGFAWPAFVDLQPLLDGERARWIGVAADATLHEVDLDAGTTRVLVDPGVGFEHPMLCLSRSGTLAAVVERYGLRGVVLDLAARRTVMQLARDGYHEEHCVFPIAFLERGGRTLLVHGPGSNRLDIVDPHTGEPLTPRPEIEHGDAHALDYFHCGLTISRDGAWIADNGWVWHPVGIVTAWNVDAWLANPYESEDGPTKRQLTLREYFWDGPLCWLDGSELAIYGYGSADPLTPAARIFDAASGDEVRWFAGPQGDFAFDRELFSIDEAQGLAVWNVARGTRLFTEPTMQHARYHPGAKTFVSIADGTISVLRGAGARWNHGRVTALADRISRERAFDDLPVLGDALEAEGCDDAALLAHCHEGAPHADRCWVLDRLG